MLVDDVQWLDGSSSDALAFALRRLSADRVAAVFTLREGEGRDFAPPSAEVLAVEGLSLDAARDLLAARLETRPPAEVVERVYALTEGNPLALLELPVHLAPEELSGVAARGALAGRDGDRGRIRAPARGAE